MLSHGGSKGRCADGIVMKNAVNVSLQLSYSAQLAAIVPFRILRVCLPVINAHEKAIVLQLLRVGCANANFGNTRVERNAQLPFACFRAIFFALDSSGRASRTH